MQLSSAPRVSRLHLVVLAAVVAVVFMATGAGSTPQVSQSTPRLNVQLSALQSGAQRVRFTEGETFVVPVGTVLVVRTLGYVGPGMGPGGDSITLEADGTPVLTVAVPFETGVSELVFGASFSAGEAVEVFAGPFVNEPAVAFGYLERP